MEQTGKTTSPASRFSLPLTGTVIAIILGGISIILSITRDSFSLNSYLEPLTPYLAHTTSLTLLVPILSFLSQPQSIVHDPHHNITYIGTTTPTTEHFQNIFYAQPPTGPLRFAPPVPLIPPPGSIIDATKTGAWCPQGTGDILPFTSKVTNISENCLSLKIARPKGTKAGDELPVIVFIHGGGHALGSAADILYTPDGLIEQSVRQGQPVVYVGINYRVGIFGFASTETLKADHHTNAGTWDQRAAFEWVQTHIAHFGGSPTHITALGQSVGASDIGLHLTSFNGGTRGVPFHRAIAVTGAVNLLFNMKTGQVQERTKALAENVGCGGANDDAAMTQCLREAPFEQLANVSVTMQRTARPPFGEHFFHPVVDGDLIAEYPSAMMREGKFVRDIPMIASWARNDGAWYPPPATTNDEQVISSFTLWMDQLKPTTIDSLLALYPLSDFEHMAPPGSSPDAQYFRAAQISRDLWFACPAIDFTWQSARYNGPENVRLWEMNQTRFWPVYEYMGVPFWGVAHLADLPYVLNTPDLPGGIDSGEAQMSLARDMSSAVIGFASEDIEAEKGKAEGEYYPGDWAPAFGTNYHEARKSVFPQEVKVKIFGGSPSSVMGTTSRGTRPQSVEDRWLDREKLFARCDFINSAEVLEQLGV